MKHEKLFNFYRQLVPLSQEEWLYAEGLMSFKKLKKGEKLIEPGDDCSTYSIVLKGLFRLYYIGADGREYIKVFRKENELLAPYAEMLQSIPSRTFIEAMENSEVCSFPADKLESLTNQSQNWKELRYKMTEKLFIEKEKKEFELLQLSAAERYENFIKNQPEVAGRVSQYHIASYLGITPVGLSRIINRK